MTIRWTHIAMTVSNIQRSIDFYTSFCGFSVIRDRRHEGGGTVWLGPNPAAGEDPIFLLVIGNGEVKFQQDHFGFRCDSREQLEGIAEKGKQLGILVSPPADFGGSVGYVMMLQDPDGNLVEFSHGQPIQGL